MFEMPPAPRLSGALLRSIARAARSEAVRRTLGSLMRRELGIEAALSLPTSLRGEQPLHPRPLVARETRAARSADAPLPSPGPLPTAAAYAEAYRSGATTPVEVAERCFAEARRLAAMTPSMACLHRPDEAAAMRDAALSAARWASGEPLGPLDGVPVPIKEEVDLAGIGARLGTSFIPATTTAVDGTVIARLRAAGALILGHTPMTEMGMSPLGVNPHRDLPRNVHAPDRVAGGSSTGSAVAVGSGLVPVALGSDGGGSIRIPASFNGLFGIKPTFGRISRHGDGFGGTMDHLGPIGASALDLAHFLDATAGPDPEDCLTERTPEPGPQSFANAIRRGVRGLRIGVLESEIDAAAADVAGPCREALDALARAGAELVPVELGLAPHAPAIGYLTIGLEAYVSLLAPRRADFDALGPDLQLFCRILETMGSGDYLDAQCLRATLRLEAAAVLREVDVLALPTTARVAPPIDAAELRSGIADTPALADACRFSFLANLTGLPAGTAPIGRGESDLPVGLQIVGDAFDEESVLAVLAELERLGVAATSQPRQAVHPLGV